VATASEVAGKGKAMVERVVQTMSDINPSPTKVGLAQRSYRSGYLGAPHNSEHSYRLYANTH
jgi:hypothetical protein